MIIPIILAGGSGTRLWPLSRQLYPKQLIRLVAAVGIENHVVVETKDAVLVAAGEQGPGSNW